MKSTRFLKFLAGLTLMICLLAVSAWANQSDGAASGPEAVSTGVTAGNPNGIPIQTYIPPEETQPHTIYWAKGLQPPLMSHDPDNYGKPGYFYKMTDPLNMPNLSQYVFTHEFDPNTNNFIFRGFYDINKTNHHRGDQQPLCYMATTLNMLHWWMDQNSDHIERYVAGLKSGQFKQEADLYDITQDSLWENLRKSSPPIPVATTDKTTYYMQSIPNDNLSYPTLYEKYRTYSSGGWMDNVAAFFLNGYDPGIVPPNEHSPNGPGKIPVPDNFEPTPLAGYFHPVCGKTTLATRHYDTSYSYLNKSFREWLLDERMIGISFYPKPNAEHAITVWGAEYDSFGNLCRIFVSDSDDETTYQLDEDNRSALHQVDGKPILRTLYSYDVYSDSKGQMFLSTDPNSNSYPMSGTVDLSLGREHWERVWNDPEPTPHAAVIEMPEEREFLYDAVKGAKPLRIQAAVPAEDADRGGYLSYQWYKSDTPEGKGEPLKGKKGPSVEPYIGTEEAVEYYYCVVTTHKYGHHTETRSPSFKITTTAVPLTHAATPEINGFSVQGYSNQNILSNPEITCNQWSEPPKITAHATASDGGNLTYQWFPVPDGTVDTDHPLGPPSASPDFYPPTGQAGTFQYHLQVTNTKPDATGEKTASKLEYRKFVVVHVREAVPPTFTVQFSNPGSQFIEPLSVQGGTSLAELPVPDHRPGYRFTGWYEDGREVTAPYQVKKDAILTAGWEAVAPRQMEYRIDAVSFRNGTSADSVQVTVSITNLLAAQVDQLVVAAYDQHGRQLGVAVQDLVTDAALLPNADKQLDPVTVHISTEGTPHSVKAFLLSKDGNSTPLAPAVSAS